MFQTYQNTTLEQDGVLRVAIDQHRSKRLLEKRQTGECVTSHFRRCAAIAQSAVKWKVEQC
jgi:hypothetical protein